MRTVVGLFDTFDHAERAVRDLEASGFDRSDLSVVTHGDVVSKRRDEGTATGAGATIGAGLGLLAGLAIIAVPGIGVVAALGPIIAGGLMGAVAGGLVGSLIDAGVPAEHAEYYAEGVRRGGTLVSVAARDEDAPRAIEIITRNGPIDLNERVLQWRQSGWSPAAESSTATVPDEPDPTGHTTMGDAAAAMPAPTMAIPAPGIQPTRENAPEPSRPVATGGAGGGALFNQMRDDFREDFDRRAPGGDDRWDDCVPAYRHGCEMACECGSADWSVAEPQAKTRWEKEHPGTWDRIKDAAHYAYERARQRV